MVHKLKTWPEYFQPVFEGKKKFEIRLNDRGFKVGDRLDLMEYEPNTKSYTGRHVHVFVKYILAENAFISLGNRIIMSIDFDK